MALANELGTAGEKAAQRYLLSRRIRILEVNWRDPLCEIDIIASDGRYLLIVEVKSRMEYTATSPLDAINVAKAHQMMLGGMRYAQRMRIDLPVRYDVVEALYCPASDLFEIKYHRGYFSAEEIALQETLPHGSAQP
ncbi:MAG: YraN family protein [Porphyromonas asaccharolytica]